MKIEFTSITKRTISEDYVIEHDWITVSSGNKHIQFKEKENYKVTIEKL